MCGIAGIVSTKTLERDRLACMSKALAHRGPDDQGTYFDGGVGLASRRLSIIDLDGGRQPLCNEDGTVWTVCNGAIYNHQDLRKELEQKGHRFRTRSDTEVIVHLYEELGERCVDRLNGMFAFAIWDKQNQKLILARDRLGQKPLFYSQTGQELLFASEVKGIRAGLAEAPQMDLISINHYLSLRFIPAPRTMFEGIQKIPPAHILVFEDDQLTLSRYWDLSFRQKLELSEEQLLINLREKLVKAVESHLVSDVPVGAFLSGGLDSSMITAIMARDLGKSFDTFAVGVTESDFNELPHARLVADRYHTRHHEQVVTSELFDLLPQITWHLDEPSDPVSACQFIASQLASRHVKVVLGGDGGDELFAGFDRYYGVPLVDYYAWIPSFLRYSILGPLIGRIPDSFSYKNTTQKLQWIHQLAESSDAGRRFAAATFFFRYDATDKLDLFAPALWNQLRKYDSGEIITAAFDKTGTDDTLDCMLYADSVTRLPEHSLMLTDRLAMAHGLECRAPFLDPDLMTFMAACPSDFKLRKRTLKYALRRLAIDYLPEKIRVRPKQGFMFPMGYWMRDGLSQHLTDLLLESSFVKKGLFRREAVQRLIQDHVTGRRDNHSRLWMLLSLEIWHQISFEEFQPGLPSGTNPPARSLR